jgi:hypothetical protein
LHDLASGLQAVGAALDELDATITDPAIRPLIEAAVAANERTVAVFVATRNTLRNPAAARDRVELGVLIGRAADRSAYRPVMGPIPSGTVAVSIPMVTAMLAALIDAAGGDAGRAELSARADGARIAIAIRAADPGPEPATIGATLAIAAVMLEALDGEVRCGDHDDRAAYTIRLPFEPR